MKFLSKKEWILIHGDCIMKSSYRVLGWLWTPQLCRCTPPHYLDTGAKNKK